MGVQAVLEINSIMLFISRILEVCTFYTLGVSIIKCTHPKISITGLIAIHVLGNLESFIDSRNNFSFNKTKGNTECTFKI